MNGVKGLYLEKNYKMPQLELTGFYYLEYYLIITFIIIGILFFIDFSDFCFGFDKNFCLILFGILITFIFLNKLYYFLIKRHFIFKRFFMLWYLFKIF